MIVTSKINMDEFEQKMKELRTFDKYITLLTYLMDCDVIEDCEKQMFSDYLSSDIGFLKFLWNLNLISDKVMNKTLDALVSFKGFFDELVENIEIKEREKVENDKIKQIIIQANREIMKEYFNQIDDLIKKNELENSDFINEIQADLDKLIEMSKKEEKE